MKQEKQSDKSPPGEMSPVQATPKFLLLFFVGKRKKTKSGNPSPARVLMREQWH